MTQPTELAACDPDDVVISVEPTQSWPAGNGEMASRIRNFHWSGTPMGLSTGWPPSLKTAVDLMLDSAFPSWVWWGPDLIQLYNDPAIAVNGTKHPGLLGTPARKVWTDLWEVIGERIEKVFATGRPEQGHDMPMIPDRGGPAESAWFTFSYSALRNEDGSVAGLFITGLETTSRMRVEVALRESDERQAFLLKLSDALRLLADPEEIQATATRLFGERLRVTRVFYFTVEPDGDRFLLRRDYADGVPSVAGWFSISQFDPNLAESWRSGHTVHSRDVHTRDANSGQPYSLEQLAAFDATQARAWLGVPLVKEGRLVAVMGVSHAESRHWTESEIKLAEEVAERTWAAVERARAEAAMRESEAKLRNLFDTMRQGYHECEMIRDAEGRAIDYQLTAMNPAFEQMVGIPVADAVGRTAREIVPGLDDWWVELFDEVVKAGEQRVHEYEVPQLGRWYRIDAYPKGGDRAAALFDDITERKLAEAVLRESEERQAFLLELSDALRPLSDPLAIQNMTTQLLGEHLQVSRAYYNEIHEDGDQATLQEGYRNGVASNAGRARISDFDDFVGAELRAGRIAAFNDVTNDPRTTAKQKSVYAAHAIAAWVGVPLVKEGRFVALLGITQSLPREWTNAEIRLLVEVAERTWAAVEQVRAEAALRESEERFRSVTEAIDDVFYMTDLDQGALLYLSPSFERVWGRPPTDMLRDLSTFVDSIHPEDRPGAVAAMAAQQHGEPAAAEYRIIRPDGQIRWIHDRCFPVPGNGRRRSAGVASDVTARKATEAALRDSEALFRQFNEFSSDVIWIRDAETMQFEYVSPAIEAIYGVAPEEFASRHNDLKAWAEIVHPDDRAQALDAFRRVRTGERVTHQFRIQRADGEIRWIRDTDFPLIDDHGRVQRIAGIGHDVTDRRRGDERQKMLLAELQHRVRNILAMIRSVTVRTAETATSVEDYCQHLEGRIGTMARTQNLLTRTIGAGVDLQNMILDELTAQAAQHTQFIVTGPDVALPAKAAEVLALAVHELATNAVKYGAFDTKGARVDVRWALLAGDPFPKLSFIWSEFGVRIDTSPTHRGFGTELITERVPYELQGIGNMEFRNEGLVATIEFPLMEAASILQTDPGHFDTAS